MSASSLASLLRPSNLEKLREATKVTPGNTRRDDEGYWKLTADKAGNGSAIIRFLPAPPPETFPFAMHYRVAFKGPNGWYINNSRTTLNESDPVADFNNKLYATNEPELKAQGSKQSRKLTYTSNIYVVSDKANPANEGKVFLFRYGKKIFEKLSKAISETPEFDGDVAFDPYHPIEGANFRLRQKQQFGFPNYDDSAFEAPSPMFRGDEAAIMAVLSQLKSLTAVVDPSNFLPYDELKKQLDQKLGFDTAKYLTPAQAAGDRPVNRSMGAEVPSTGSAIPAPSDSPRAWKPPVVEDDDDTDAALSRFDDE